MMTRFLIPILIIPYVLCFGVSTKFYGCYKELPSLRTVQIQEYRTVEQCINDCNSKYFRYAYIRNEGQCICGNFLDEQVSNTTCDLNMNLTNVYETGNLVSGPPRNFQIDNITNTSVHISWEEPESFVEILQYKINAIILHTFSTYPSVSPEWLYSNNTFKTQIITLIPATKYNITISTTSSTGNGPVVYRIIQTRVGDVDSTLQSPKIIGHDENTITITFDSVTSNNGPITAYRIVVVDDESKQGFEKDTLYSYSEAKRNGLHYYITAELNPKDVSKRFIVGDGQNYGKYYNAPLNSKIKYTILLGAVSSLDGTTTTAYSPISGTVNGVLILNTDLDASLRGDNPVVIIVLSIAIALVSLLFVAGIIGFIILKSRVANRRQRLSDNQELTLQGPMVEVENNGYVHEEDVPVNYYRNLKQKVRTLSATQLKIEPNIVLGMGKFGQVNTGSFNENDTIIPIAAYSIPDKKLSPESKRSMLQDLDLLIRCGKHENVLSLIGTCETQQMVCVALEFVSMNLKDLLLGSRDSLPGRFSNMSEAQALDISIQIVRGMMHLESIKIIHKQLCTRSIMITNNFVPKIGGYGIAQYFSHNKIPDYTRWTAIEVFKSQPYNPKSDIWSFGCLLWEICVLGGTPYGNISNNNKIPEQIIRGLRLPQMQYFRDDFYQILLECWQIDPDERPKCIQLLQSLEDLKGNNPIPFINFNLHSNFQYEQFYPDMEFSVRPVF